MRFLVIASVLLLFACGGKESVASKSAAAYRDAQAKGVKVGGGHDHGGHATTTDAHAGHTDHSAHGTPADAHAGHGAAADTHAGHGGGGAMDHSAHAAGGTVDHSAHRAGGSTVDHSAHGAGGTVDHSAHRAGSSTVDHSAHRAGGTTDHSAHRAGGTTDHSAHRAGGTTTDHSAHAGHSGAPASSPAGPAASSPPQDHSAHTAHSAPPPGRRDGARPAGGTPALREDAFDAPAPSAVTEAEKARQGGGHEGHQLRGIVPGEDHANPPTAMPARRDGSDLVYACPMHPEVTSDRPGTCPKCGMALVERR